MKEGGGGEGVATEVIRAADYDRRKTEIVGYSLHGVSAAHLVASRMTGVGGAIFRGRMLARRDRDNKLAVRFQFIAGHKMVFFFDGRRAGAIGARNRGQRVPFRHFVVAPPHPHRNRYRFDRRHITVSAADWQTKLKALLLGSR